MNTAIITYENGDVVKTDINGTISSIQKYFAIGSWFNIGSATDNMQQVKSITVVTKLNWR